MITTTSSQFTLISRFLALAIVILDFAQIRYSWDIDSSLLALVGVVAVLCLNNDAEAGLGLQPLRRQSWSYWIRFGLLSGIGIGIVLSVCALIWLKVGWKIPLVRTEPSLSILIWMCLRAPVVEEVIYRSLLAVAIAPTVGTTGTIICSGIIFAGGHVLAGVAGPENQIAGFLLAWAFLRSESILVPIALHAAGNFVALAIQFSYWNWK